MSSAITDWQLLVLLPFVIPLLFPEQVPVSLLVLALLGLPALWLVSKLARGTFVPRTPLDIPWLIVLAVLIVSLWASALPQQTLPQTYKILIAAVLYYAVINTLGGESRLGWGAAALLLGTLLIASVSLLGTEWTTKFAFLPTALSSQLPRLVEPFWNRAGFNPNIVGGTLAVMVPVTVAYTWGTPGWRRLPLALALIFEIAVLALTQSRGGIIGFAVGVAVVALARDWRWGLLWAVSAAVVAAGVLVYGPSQVLDLVVSGVTDPVASAQGRLELWSRALYMVSDFPYTGIGMGMFSRIVPVLYPLFLAGPDTVIEHAHNLVLQIATDYGIPGLIAWLAQMGLLLWMGAEAVLQTRDGRWWPLAAGLLGGLVAYLVHGLTDSFTYYAKGHTLVWGCLSLIVALWLVCCADKRENAQHATDVSG